MLAIQKPIEVTLADGPGAGTVWRFASNAGAWAIIARLLTDVLTELAAMKQPSAPAGGPAPGAARKAVVDAIRTTVLARPTMFLAAVMLPQAREEALKGYALSDEDIAARTAALEFMSDEDTAEVWERFRQTRLASRLFVTFTPQARQAAAGLREQLTAAARQVMPDGSELTPLSAPPL